MHKWRAKGNHITSMAHSLDTLSEAKTYGGASWQSGDVTNSPTQITCHLLKWIISVSEDGESQGHAMIRLDHWVNGSVLSVNSI